MQPSEYGRNHGEVRSNLEYVDRFTKSSNYAIYVLKYFLSANMMKARYIDTKENGFC